MSYELWELALKVVKSRTLQVADLESYGVLERPGTIPAVSVRYTWAQLVDIAFVCMFDRSLSCKR